MSATALQLPVADANCSLQNGSCRPNNWLDDGDDHGPNLWWLALVLFPAACIFGNLLVVLAVLSERSLKTSTNFLLVSLACADLLVGTLVMPFSVYLTINRLQWYLPDPVCNFFCVVDVSASTSSIVHLVCISIDRFYAVVRHMDYKSPRHKRRVYGTIAFSWCFSIGIGLPLGIGLNRGESKAPHQCDIVNPDYMLYSSLFAFYIPCLVMLVMYSFVFYRLHRRMKVVKLQEMAAGQMMQFGDHLSNILKHAYGERKDLRQASMVWAMPFLKHIEATIAENEDISVEELDELTTILHTLESDQTRSMINDTMEANVDSPENGQMPSTRVADRFRARRHLSMILAAYRRRSTSSSFSGSEYSRRSNSDRRRRQSLYQAKQKIRTLKNRAIELLMKLKSKQGMAIRKETRATKLVATVMLVFLLCYMPFFTLNIVKVFRLRANTWNQDLNGLFIFFTWLGYFNSCLNPLIYSLFNRKFRATFRKLLHCPGEQTDSPLGRQRRLYSKPFVGDADERNWLMMSQRGFTSPRHLAQSKQISAPNGAAVAAAVTAAGGGATPTPPSAGAGRSSGRASAATASSLSERRPETLNLRKCVSNPGRSADLLRTRSPASNAAGLRKITECEELETPIGPPTLKRSCTADAIVAAGNRHQDTPVLASSSASGSTSTSLSAIVAAPRPSCSEVSVDRKSSQLQKLQSPIEPPSPDFTDPVEV